MAEIPTSYFPDNLLVKFGFKQPRLWNTTVLTSPPGRTMRIKKWPKPKRLLGGTIIGYDDATFTVLREWMDLNMQGQYKSFYVFNWKSGTYEGPKTREYPNGVLWGGGPPIVLPFLGGDLFEVLLNGSVAGLANFTVDDGGPAGEKQITATTLTPAPTDLVTVLINETRERVPVRSTKDMDDFDFDWSAAVPPTETPFDLEEL